MNAELITDIASFVAIVVAVFSLMRQLQSQFYAEYTRRYSELMDKMPPEFFDSKKADSIELDGEMLKKCRLYYDLSSEEYELHRQCRLNHRVWRYWKEGIKDIVNLRVFAKAWDEILSTQYNDSFQKFVMDLRHGKEGTRMKTRFKIFKKILKR